MSTTTQDISVQTTPKKEENNTFPRAYSDFTGDGREYWKLAEYDFMGGCKLGAAYAVACFNFISNNPMKGSILSVISMVGTPEFCSAKEPDRKIGFSVGFYSVIHSIFAKAAPHIEVNEVSEDDESSTLFYQHYHKHYKDQHATYIRLEKEDKARTSERCRKAAMIRWHGKQAVEL